MNLPTQTPFILDMVSAFLIPIVLAIILYPLMRKANKTWRFLWLLASLLSFVLIALKEIFNARFPIIDILFTYILGNILGVFIGILALYYLFNFRSRWLAMSAGDDIFFHKYHISYRIHLRHLLQAAIASEEEGHHFYQRLSKKVTDPKVKDLCRHLAEEEIKHRKLFQSVLNRWLSRPADKKSLSNLLNELKTQGLFLNPPPPDVSEEEMIAYAVKQEETTADFYLSLEKAFPEAWKRMKVQNLAAEERAHAQKLIDAFPQFFKNRIIGS